MAVVTLISDDGRHLSPSHLSKTSASVLSGKRDATNVTSSMDSEIWLCTWASYFEASSPRPRRSSAEQVGIKRGVMTGKSIDRRKPSLARMFKMNFSVDSRLSAVDCDEQRTKREVCCVSDVNAPLHLVASLRSSPRHSWQENVDPSRLCQRVPVGQAPRRRQPKPASNRGGWSQSNRRSSSPL